MKYKGIIIVLVTIVLAMTIVLQDLIGSFSIIIGYLLGVCMIYIHPLMYWQPPSRLHQIIKPGHVVGNTTRLVDMYVQHFFTTGMCTVRDHYGTRKAHERTFDLVLRRLEREHNYRPRNLIINKNKLTIKRRPL